MSHPYASAAYARVFADVAEPLWVEAWGTHVLVRHIPGGGRDAIGMYPLTVLAPDADLRAGLEALRAAGLVSVGLAPDPATAPPAETLQAAFDVCAPFKTHLLVDSGQPVRFSKHHRYEVKKALGQVDVAVAPFGEHLDAWIGLYGELIERHEVGGLSRLSPAAFARLTDVEGLTAVGAFADGVLVSMHLWIADEARGLGYSLFAASSAEGYRRSAAYAVYDASIRALSHLRLLNLGGGAGLTAADDGLTRFKRGFANAEAQGYFCGAVLDPERYAALSGGRCEAALPFPAYRFPAGVWLRPLRAEDLPQLHRWYQTPELWDHLVGDFTPRGEAEALAYMERWLVPSQRELRLAVEAGGRLVGLASLSPVDREGGWAELHLLIGEPGQRGRGFGRAATAALLERGFADFGLQCIELKVLERNAAARRVYEACGFRVTGRAAPVVKAGAPAEVLVMQADQPRSATT